MSSPDQIANVFAITSQYEIDVDFNVGLDVNEKDYYVNVAININNGNNKLLGHVVFIEGIGVFEFDTSFSLAEQQKNEYIHQTGLLFCIGHMRSVVMDLTSQGPFGKYIIPPIDAGKLISDKYASQSAPTQQ